MVGCVGGYIGGWGGGGLTCCGCGFSYGGGGGCGCVNVLTYTCPFNPEHIMKGGPPEHNWCAQVP